MTRQEAMVAASAIYDVAIEAAYKVYWSSNAAAGYTRNDAEKNFDAAKAVALAIRNIAFDVAMAIEDDV